MRPVVYLVAFFVVFVVHAHAQEDPAQAPPLTLQEAIDTALHNHPTIHIGQATIEAAQQRVQQQVAGYLPQGRYAYTYSRQERPLTSAVGGVQVGGIPGITQRSTSQLFNFNSMNVSMTQLLFDFGGTLNAIRSAAASADASAADLETTKQTVIFNTKQAYYGLFSAQRLLQVADETVRQNQKHLEEAQARFEVGVAPRFDVTQAQVQVSNAELNRVTARNNVSLGYETLRTAMGQTEPLRAMLVEVSDRRAPALDAEAVLRQAYTRRPELHSLSAQQRAAAEHVAALQKQHLPSISGTAQYNWTGREYPLQRGWLWGVTLTMPLFDDILTVAQVGEAQATTRNLQAQVENIRQQVQLEVRQGLLNLQQAEESIRVSEQTLVQARENLDLAEGRYAAGVGNIIELTDAQVSLTSAQANTIKAFYDYKTAQASVEKAIGQPLE